jgi:hypothetical protein
VERLEAAGVLTVSQWRRQRLTIFGMPETLAVRVDYAVAKLDRESV